MSIDLSPALQLRLTTVCPGTPLCFISSLETKILILHRSVSLRRNQNFPDHSLSGPHVSSISGSQQIRRGTQTVMGSVSCRLASSKAKSIHPATIHCLYLTKTASQYARGFEELSPKLKTFSINIGLHIYRRIALTLISP